MPYHRSEEHTSELQSHDNLYAVSLDRKSTRLNSSHTIISYAVFCLKKKKNNSASRVTRTTANSLATHHTRAAAHGTRLFSPTPRRPQWPLLGWPRVFFFLKERPPPEIYPLPPRAPSR